MKNIKLLMVDDEKQFRETTAKILSRRGYQTTVAASGEEALDVLGKERHDVVVLDIKMPGMDGLDALAKIKELDKSVQVIMLTGHGGEESAKESLKHGAFDYLNKPCEIDLLTARINDAFLSGQKGKKEERKAKNVMISVEDYTTIGPDSTVREGIERLKSSFETFVSTSRIMQTGHRSILVLDTRGKLIGVLTILDLAQALRPSYLSAPKPSMADSMQYSPMFWTGLFTSQVKKLADKKIRDIMSPPPPAIDEDTNLMEVANLLYTKQSRRLAVMRGDTLVGVVREQEIFFEVARIILES